MNHKIQKIVVFGENHHYICLIKLLNFSPFKLQLELAKVELSIFNLQCFILGPAFI